MILRGVLLLLVATLAFCSYVYYANVRLLDHRYPVVASAVPSAVGADAVERGKRLAAVTGCTDCHAEDLRGKLFIDEGWLHGRIYSANLTLKAKHYSDEDFSRLVRLGVRPDGRGVNVMPSMGFVRLTDEEMADIVAFVRSLPAGGAEQPDHFIGPLDHWALWRGQLKPAIAYLERERAKQLPEAGAEHAAARHLVGIVCVECHSGDLKGNGWDSGAPDLAVARAYSLDAFRKLLRTGTAVGDRQLGLMSTVARDRLHHLSDEQIAGIHAYLLAYAGMAR